MQIGFSFLYEYFAEIPRRDFSSDFLRSFFDENGNSTDNLVSKIECSNITFHAIKIEVKYGNVVS